MLKTKSFHLLFALATLIIFCTIPDNSYGQLGSLKRLKNKAIGSDDQGITSPIHKKYLGKIVFSEQKIDLDNPDESTFQVKFNVEDEIWTRLYLSRSLEKESKTNLKYSCPNGDCHMSAKLYIDGDFKYDVAACRRMSSKEATTQQINLRTEDEYSLAWNTELLAMTTGEHIVRIDFYGGNCKWEGKKRKSTADTDKLATGEFIIIKKEGAIIPELVSEFYKGDFKSKWDNPTLKTDLLSTVKEHASKLGWKEDFTDLHIVNSNWGVSRNEISGIILSRSIVGACYAVWPDGHCTVQLIVFHQDNIGGDNYSKDTYVGGIGSQRKVICK